MNSSNRPEIPLTTPILLEVVGVDGSQITAEFLGHVSLARAWLSIQKHVKSAHVAPEAAVRSAGEWLERHHPGRATELSAAAMIAACLIEGFVVKQSKRQPDHPRLGISRKTMRRDSTRERVEKHRLARDKKRRAETEWIRAELQRRYKQLDRWKKRGSPPATRPWFVSPPPEIPAPAPIPPNPASRKVEHPQVPLPSIPPVAPPVVPPPAPPWVDPRLRRPRLRLVAVDGVLF